MNKLLPQSIFGKSVFGILFIFLLSFNGNTTDYYVNDNDLTLDVFTTAIGNSGNNGLTPATPKATLTEILTTYGGVLTSGDVINIDAGTYFQTDIQLVISIARLTIQGAGTTLTLFDNSGHGGTQENFMRILADNVTLLNFTVTGYDYDPGGRGKAITVSGATGVVIDGIASIDNYNNGDSAMMVTSNSEVTFLNSMSSCNSGTYGGGYRIEGINITVLFNNCIIAQNSISAENGGGIYISGSSGATSNIDVTIQNSSIENNGAVRGGGIFIEHADLSASGSCFDSNSGVSSNDGGGALYVGYNSTITLNNCVFTDNTANQSSADGGAISVIAQNSSVSIQQCSFSGNSANDDGDAIYVDRAFSGGTAVVTVNESIFGASQTVFRKSDASLTVTNSGARQPDTGTSAIAGNNTAQSLGAASTSCPSVVDPCNLTILPVEFLDFSIACEGKKVQFNWSTATERNNDYFTVSYSNDFVSWDEVLRKNGKGNTQTQSNYKASLEHSKAGYYQISQTDVDGKRTELKTVFSNSCNVGLDLLSVNYKSINSTLTLNYSIQSEENVAVQLIDNTGKLILSEFLFFSNDSNQLEVTTPRSLSKGMYYLNVQSKEASQTINFVVVE